MGDDRGVLGRLMGAMATNVDTRLELELRGQPSNVPEAEQELSRAIVEATVDEVELAPERAVLVKLLPAR